MHIIPKLYQLLEQQQEAVDGWFTKRFYTTNPFFYSSVDIRHSGFKLAPVDTNLFPAGFNNLAQREEQGAVDAIRHFAAQSKASISRMLIIAEDHTRNLYYLDHLALLTQLIQQAGIEVILSNFAVTGMGEITEYTSKSGHRLRFHPITRVDDHIETMDGFSPDFILVNNDMTTGAPELLQNLTQPIMPPLGFGWYLRRKTSHFDSYDQLLREFCRQFQLDSWLFSAYYDKCGVINFKERSGLECVAKRTEKLLYRIRKKYEEYDIKDTPYAFIKSNQGTYGMGIMTVRSGDELYDMGKKLRKKMETIKGGTPNTEVIIQEGIPTIDKVEGNPAEPMMYLIGDKPVGCIYRLNTERDHFGNLNAKGMQFSHLEEENTPCKALGLIAKIAAYAAVWECYSESYAI